MSKIKALVVEDEILIRMYIVSILKDLGCDIAGESSTGETAIEMALDRAPDIIFMDIKLAGKMDGVEAAKQISMSLPIPIVFMSAYTMEKQFAGAQMNTFWGYLPKPVESYSIKAFLQRLA